MLSLAQLYPPDARAHLPVKLYPGLIAETCRTSHGASRARALALWSLARAVDLQGTGRMDYALLREWAGEIWSDDKFYRALREAVALGLMRIARRNPDRTKVIVMTSLEKIARALGVERLGAAPIVVKIGALRTATTFKAALFGAFQTARARNSERPISREILHSLSGVSRVTQLHYEKQLGGAIQKQTNYLLLNCAADSLSAMREFVHGACFCVGEQVARRLPNAYRGRMVKASASRLKKVNRKLKAHRLMVHPDVGPGRFRRLFFDSSRGLDQDARKNLDAPGIPTGLQPALILTRFVKAGETSGGGALWRSI